MVTEALYNLRFWKKTQISIPSIHIPPCKIIIKKKNIYISYSDKARVQSNVCFYLSVDIVSIKWIYLCTKTRGKCGFVKTFCACVWPSGTKERWLRTVPCWCLWLKNLLLDCKTARPMTQLLVKAWFYFSNNLIQESNWQCWHTMTASLMHPLLYPACASYVSMPLQHPVDSYEMHRMVQQLPDMTI